jgi:hypothetical protein
LAVPGVHAKVRRDGYLGVQPFGPGRTQRRLIYIDPQLRGPHDKPIKAGTTVRILGTTAPPPNPLSSRGGGDEPDRAR